LLAPKYRIRPSDTSSFIIPMISSTGTRRSSHGDAGVLLFADGQGVFRQRGDARGGAV
jgi:hypothetical protein